MRRCRRTTSGNLISDVKLIHIKDPLVDSAGRWASHSYHHLANLAARSHSIDQCRRGSEHLCPVTLHAIFLSRYSNSKTCSTHAADPPLLAIQPESYL